MGHRDIPPTFPVSQEKLREEKLKAITRSPLTWAVFGMAATSLLLAPNLVGLLVAAGFAAGGAVYWACRLPKLEESMVGEIIEDTNEEQNESLERGIRQLKKWDHDDYAAELSRFLEVKKRIEQTIHGHAPRTSFDENVETLVDTLCNEVSRDLFKMADIRYTLKKRRKRLSDAAKQDMKNNQQELGDRVKLAHQALTQAEEQLLQVTGRTIPDEGANPVLDRTIERLQEEAALAKRVRDRISTTFGDELESPQTTYGQTGQLSE